MKEQRRIPFFVGCVFFFFMLFCFCKSCRWGCGEENEVPGAPAEETQRRRLGGGKWGEVALEGEG